MVQLVLLTVFWREIEGMEGVFFANVFAKATDVPKGHQLICFCRVIVFLEDCSIV
jgi:hypothetical protein